MNRKLDDAQTPRFMYGTAWKEDETNELTRLAIDCGFRAIDTANQRKHYHEAGVGEAVSAAIDEGVVARDQLFLQTKFTYVAGQDHRLPYDADAPFARQVEQSFASSLEHLQTDYIDSYLLHGPSTRTGLGDADREVWASMTELVGSEQVGAIGVSNVSAGQLETLIDWAEHAPEYVQNRCFARTGWDHQVRQVCEANDIVYQGFSLLTANAQELRSQQMAQIAQRHDKTVAQVVFRFATQIGMLPLTGTSSEQHMKQDLAYVDFELDAGEIDAIEAIASR
jgi:diketogulonate reductase-like aldo/keto reductase